MKLREHEMLLIKTIPGMVVLSKFHETTYFVIGRGHGHTIAIIKKSNNRYETILTVLNVFSKTYNEFII
jgi:hypothetical protein